MMFLLVVLVAGLFRGCAAILCYDDIALQNVQEYTYNLPHKPTSKYWNKYTPKSQDRIVVHNLHLSYTLFGKFVGDPSDATISAGYYKANDSLIFSVEVDCGAGKWRSFAPTESDPAAPYEEGDLEGNCADGDIFDLILKTQQAHLMSWLYNGQPLQKFTQKTKFTKGRGVTIFRDRPLYVPSLDERPTGGASDAAKFVVKTTGAAVITRLAFGRCIAWPEEITKDCPAVNNWIKNRSKGDPAKDGGVGTFGASNFIFKMSCLQDTKRYLWLQEIIHPDEFSPPKSAYCCCVNMETGRVFDDDRKKYCENSKTCQKTCTDAFDDKFLPADFAN